MKFIDKSTAVEPVEFAQWKLDDAVVIQREIDDTTLSAEKLWSHGEYKKEVKEQLVKEQFGICCYCGSRIFADHNTAIEHFQPKSKFRELVFDYNNLGASCMGGSKNIVYFLKAGETVEDLTNKFGISYEHLEDVFVNTDLEREKLIHQYDIENLRVGDRIIIFKSLPNEEQHCDTRKGANEIEILPTNTNCEKYFTYEKRTGKIKTPSLFIENTVNTLGLNDNKYLTRERLRKIEQATQFSIRLVNVFKNDPTTLRQKLQQKKKNLITPNDEGLLDPYCMVYLSVLNN